MPKLKINSPPQDVSTGGLPEARMAKGVPVYTVAEVTRDIKLLLENTFGEILVEGEISNFRAYASGHFYFSLKDQEAVLSAVMFSRANRGLKFKIENGMKMICAGKISVYEPHGQYQLIVERIEPKGMGGLQLALDQLKEKLEKEGLFSQEHKRQIPYLPSRIGVVTSLSGAAIKDMLQVLERRFRDVHIIISPAQVQGEQAKYEIADAISQLNRFNATLPKDQKIEVMIVGRGGGSIEDLWAFNEEMVARAIYHSAIPVISAVGHQRDWTVSDLVADMRAPTPSVAAELVLPQKEDLQGRIEELSKRLKVACGDHAERSEDAVREYAHRMALSFKNIIGIKTSEFQMARNKLLLLSPLAAIDQQRVKVADRMQQLAVRMTHFLQLRSSALRHAAEKLSGLSPLNILARGYSITFKASDGSLIKEYSQLRPGDTMSTRLHKGEIISSVKEVHAHGRDEV